MPRPPREDWRGGRPQTALSQGRPRPFLHNRTRAPAPPLSGGARARPLRAHRDYALLPLPHEELPRSAPHPPHTSTHLPPACSTGSQGGQPPPKNTHPRVQRNPPAGSPPRPWPGVLSPQSCFGRSSLRVPLGVSLGLSREAPRTAQAQARRSGLAASSPLTKRSQAPVPRLGRREGGREGNSEGGRGGGERWRNRLRRLYRRGRFSVTREIPPTPPARPAEGRLNFAPPQAALSARQRFNQSLSPACRLPAPSPSTGRGGGAAHLLHAPIGGELP